MLIKPLVEGAGITIRTVNMVVIAANTLINETEIEGE
jgi:hypothetical protein